MNWIGVSLPLGKVTCDQMRGLAKIAQDLGDGDIRLTVWQNLLIPGVRDENVELAIAAIKKIGLAVEASQIRAGLIACTGNAGCRFAASNTKRHAAEIGDWCEPRVNIDTPLNIHVTGCHHSCAQHYISDIGLIAAKVDVGEDVDPVEGYHLFTGGGFGPDADVGQEVYHDLKAEDAPKTVERLLKAYLAHRSSPEETFLTFARRHDGETLRKLRRCSRCPHEPDHAAAEDRDHSLERAVLRGAALLAERVLCRIAVGCADAAVGGAGRGRHARRGGDGDDGEAPWHDQTMPIADRMKLAEGRPLRRRMMAAMAQQDCGQCGYDCHNYSEAIASKSEARLNLCVPGGKETARMLKSLYEEIDKAPAAPSSAPAAAPRCAPLSWRSPAARATIRSRRPSCRAAC